MIEEGLQWRAARHHYYAQGEALIIERPGWMHGFRAVAGRRGKPAVELGDFRAFRSAAQVCEIEKIINQSELP